MERGEVKMRSSLSVGVNRPYLPLNSRNMLYANLRIEPGKDPAPQNPIPVYLILLIDCSYSMKGERLSRAKEAAKAAIDAMHPADNAESANFGMEYVFNGMIALRGGYKYNIDEGGFAAGAGFKYSVAGIMTKLDYSYTDFGRLNAVHRASIGFGF